MEGNENKSIPQGRVKFVRVRNSDGSVSDALAFVVNAENVDFEDKRNLLEHLDDKALSSIYSKDGINLGRSPLLEKDQDEIIVGEKSVAMGHLVKAEGDFSLATGSETKASGLYAHAEGNQTIAAGMYSHAEGGGTVASGTGSHSEGYYTEAAGDFAHSEGYLSKASGKYSHAQGADTVAEGENSFASGFQTVAKGKNSIALGQGTIAASNYQFVHGTYNIEDTEGKYIEIMGNGTEKERSNAYAVTKEGDVEFSGKVYASSFEGPAIYDIQGQKIADYVLDIKSQNGNELVVKHGSGVEDIVVLDGWENIQEKIGAWSCKGNGVVNSTERKIANFGYANKTKYDSSLIIYGQAIVYASPLEGRDSIDFSLRMFIDDEEYDANWHPKETLRRGYHIITFMQTITNIPPDPTKAYVVDLFAKAIGGSASYETGGIRVTIFGMGIDSGSVMWNGQIEYEENVYEEYNIRFIPEDVVFNNYRINFENTIKEEIGPRNEKGEFTPLIPNRILEFYENVLYADKKWDYNIKFEEEDYVFGLKDMPILIPKREEGIGIPLFAEELIIVPETTGVVMSGDGLKTKPQEYSYLSRYISLEDAEYNDWEYHSNKNIVLRTDYSEASKEYLDEIDNGVLLKLNIDLEDLEVITLNIQEDKQVNE